MIVLVIISTLLYRSIYIFIDQSVSVMCLSIYLAIHFSSGLDIRAEAYRNKKYTSFYIFNSSRLQILSIEFDSLFDPQTLYIIKEISRVNIQNPIHSKRLLLGRTNHKPLS